MGGALLQQCAERRLVAADIDAAFLLPSKLNDQVLDISSFVNCGKVKIADAAHARLLTHEGVTRNHLVAQFLAFRIDDEDEHESELLSALCAGIVIADVAGAKRQQGA